MHHDPGQAIRRYLSWISFQFDVPKTVKGKSGLEYFLLVISLENEAVCCFRHAEILVIEIAG
jgi:hypothetical protein